MQLAQCPDSSRPARSVWLGTFSRFHGKIDPGETIPTFVEKLLARIPAALDDKASR